MKKADIGSGYRAAKEALRLFPKKTHAIAAIGCGRNTIYEWSCGVAPSALHLARLHELGADVIWILTGKHETGRRHHSGGTGIGTQGGNNGKDSV